MPVSGNKLGAALCSALGIDTTNVRSLVIRADVMSAAVVEVTRYVSEADADAVSSAVETYNVIESTQ